MSTTHFRTCPLCEATCGVEISMNDGHVLNVRGDAEDIFSKGYICPKATAIKHLHEDPDRLVEPMIRDDSGWHSTTWDDAFATVEAGLRSVIEKGGADAVALYIGNPTVHSLSATIMTVPLVRALGSKNFYSAASVDQMPKHVSCGYMFGRPEMIPVPDIDRTDYLVILGANPWVSNGSLATAPDFRGRLKAISERGGKVVVVDPRRTETAAGCDEHVFIRPGTDALFLLAMAYTIFDEDRVSLGTVAAHVDGVEEVRALVKPYSPEAVAPHTKIEAGTIRRIARELADAPSGSVYDRVGAHQQEFGTLASWASDVVNVITGNLDSPGGRMFPMAAHARPDPPAPVKKGWRTGKYASRVKGYPEAFGQLPIATLADEIETPGDGQVRGFVTVGGNPVLSAPNGNRLGEALSTLDFMVAVDPYLNETTRFANVILPPPSTLAKHHYDFVFYGLAVRSIANYSPPLVPSTGPDEWEIMARLALVLSGQDVADDPAIVPRLVLDHLIEQTFSPDGPLGGRDRDDVLEGLTGRGPIEQILDLRLRVGPFGDLFGLKPDGLSLAVLEANPHGVDLGPMVPRLPNALRTASGKVELAPPAITSDLARLQVRLEHPGNGLVLIGRRQLRSNNSWMHNLPTMVRGSNRCTLMVHPEDAKRLGLSEGGSARIRSRVGEVAAPVEITDEMMPGVVSLPHGWGHGAPDVRMAVARANAGVSVNDVTDASVVDPPSGNAVLNAVPVEVEPMPNVEPIAEGSAATTS